MVIGCLAKQTADMVLSASQPSSGMIVVSFLLASFLALEVKAVVRYSNGAYSVCGTSPELSAQHSTSCIKGGYNTIHPITPKQACSTTARYRTHDGRCNAKDDRGATMSEVKRLMPPHYQGPDSGPRTMSSVKPGVPLPSARAVSRAVHRPKASKSEFTLLLMQVGQFLDHDMTAIPVPTETDDTIRCCNTSDNSNTSRHRECFPIEIPPGDHQFQECMEFVRSDPLKFPNETEYQPRTHVNSLTAFIDASMVYGSSEERAKALRIKDGKGALLKTKVFRDQERLPEGHNDTCINRSPSHFCAMAGDERVNEQPGLTALHTVFHLEHNRLVRKLAMAYLKTTNKEEVEIHLQNSSDAVLEKFYQEVRKVLGAVWQNIVYTEYIPLIIGPDIMAEFNLTTGRKVAFDPDVDPSVSAEFVTAAFRYGHTLVSDLMMTDQANELRELFSVSAHNLESFPKIVRGLVSAGKFAAETFDPNMADSLVDHLFENKETGHPGLDLAALNIQRGRDHGLPSFNELREFLGLCKFTKWRQFGASGEALETLYEHPDDVDCFTGGTSESSVVNGVVGEVFALVLGRQFHDLKYGDRYYFETNNNAYGFKNDQLETIRTLRLSKILCENAKVKYIQANPFKPPNNESNPLHRCSELPDINMSAFLDVFPDTPRDVVTDSPITLFNSHVLGPPVNYVSNVRILVPEGPSSFSFSDAFESRLRQRDPNEELLRAYLSIFKGRVSLP
ncbi:salivary peroxidase/catechol oxidase-like [Littorina saxatilis]|uniref:salivary peroxidase/catechol oxidase-like n=1 Tax=Littorina saxatilis TaxID=31220 RepID=UPI0038B57A06